MSDGFVEMKGHLLRFPSMWRETWELCESFRPDLPKDPRALLLSGMGGSSIGGAILQAIAEHESAVPIILNRSYSVPAWLDQRSIAVFTSYSGNTEETLSAFERAGKSNARRLAVTTGGKLAESCNSEGVSFCQIPGGLPPRAALPYTLVPQLHVARSMGVVSIDQEDIDEASVLIDELARAEADGSGPATEIANRLVGKIPVVFSGPGLLSAVNLRWRGQIQENAKSLAFGNVYPELNHNEIVGWSASDSITPEVVVIELADEEDAGAILKRMDLTRSLLEEKAGAWIRIESKGHSRLARAMWTILLGDWVSFRLAEMKDVDPMPVALIDALKSGLADS